MMLIWASNPCACGLVFEFNSSLAAVEAVAFKMKKISKLRGGKRGCGSAGKWSLAFVVTVCSREVRQTSVRQGTCSVFLLCFHFLIVTWIFDLTIMQSGDLVRDSCVEHSMVEVVDSDLCPSFPQVFDLVTFVASMKRSSEVVPIGGKSRGSKVGAAVL